MEKGSNGNFYRKLSPYLSQSFTNLFEYFNDNFSVFNTYDEVKKYFVNWNLDPVL